MISYKLSYFNMRGLAEPARFIFAYAGVYYEDYRIEMEDWASVKSSYPMGQVPVLDVNGIRINQSLAIARYLGKVTQLAGNNEIEDAIIAAAAFNINDFRSKIVVLLNEKNETIKKKKEHEIRTLIVPEFLNKIEGILMTNGGYLAFGKLSWADMYFASLRLLFKKFAGDSFNSDVVETYFNKIYEIPSIKKWIKNRPTTEW